jgi:hypothetical protein
VYGLAKVTSLLGIPPVAVRVAELSLDGWRIDVAAILVERYVRLVIASTMREYLTDGRLPFQGLRRRSGSGIRDISRRASSWRCRLVGKSIVCVLGEAVLPPASTSAAKRAGGVV